MNSRQNILHTHVSSTEKQLNVNKYWENDKVHTDKYDVDFVGRVFFTISRKKVA